MKRKTAIKYLLLSGFSGTLLFSSYKLYQLLKDPDIKFLSAQHSLLEALAETILPSTDSPGAGTPEVSGFIIIMVKDCLPVISQNIFILGLQNIISYTFLHYGKTFEDCTAEERKKILHVIEKKDKPFNGFTKKVHDKLLGLSFFTALKKYTVYGYCTSKEGAMKGLNYLPVPGSYHGITNLKPGQKAWALN